MTFGDPSLGLGEWMTAWVIIAVFAIAIIGYVFGVALGGAVVFFIIAAIAVLIGYALLSRAYRLLLHGSIRAGGED